VRGSIETCQDGDSLEIEIRRRSEEARRARPERDRRI